MNPEQNTQTDNEVLVKVEGLSKKFCKDLKTSLWYGVKDLMTGIGGSTNERELRPKEFWAVKDINFELRRGECLGLIGHNGAGKSTLLKILNGLINPDAGKVTIKGRVGALIELGAGFNPILSGRENIYNNGAILGFTRQEIDQKLDAIIAFAELEEFIDMPVQHYSSGMKVRLGFAVAAQMEPDVLIIDEVLAVGDLGFVLKCFKTIDRILPNTAVIFVSHSMPMISRMCNQIILMEKGQSKFQGEDVGKAIDLYYTRFSNSESNVIFDDGTLNLEKAEIIGGEIRDNLKQLHWKEDFKVHLKFKLLKELKDFECFIIILDKEQRPVASLERNKRNNNFTVNNNAINLLVVHKNIQLSKGVYSVNVAIRNKGNKEPIFRMNSVLSFQIVHHEETWEPFLLESEFIDFKTI
ncbi:lipopolysaccharide transport system ATP-binding protein [Mesoflavibacter sabulilitoris]|uniref:ABC transporter ATP-binding protein n=1 Tax=Mesoflavibacter zeaxanthinifaciens subsp. sabulilitoris TaxID=1520893 RepID=A0A2T1NB09_9FLAO|nr:ABC transporter ATP-binding protein [Mesoflavibacter zeaxanthinifaciens]MBB3123549.1 lipopolysaccharide transport system ATP-binding protein [Mesoflavibacter zeaxanthinifaciens subsp. sabulilitoris]PSG89320.1 ABC transporter ATP-binding protein [Mesoflavibacter zeaxanthinifaciens subsp. sabulilitoris]